MTKQQYTIYVIRLKRTVLQDRRFISRNPDYIEGRPCVYVGVTYLLCDERFKQHKEGTHAARIARKFGKRCVDDLSRRTRPISRRHALSREATLAATLKKKGWGVWSN